MPIYESYTPNVSAARRSGAPIILRDEQKDAIKEAKKQFKGKQGKKFLWNAKMRFGKTLSALQLAKELDVKRTLIVTHRPVVDANFREDFSKIFGADVDKTWFYASRSDNGGTGEISSLETMMKTYSDRHYVFFASMQYLCRSNLVNSKSNADTNPLKHLILNNDWDLVVVDEAHEATTGDTQGAAVVKYLSGKKANVLHLSGTPFNLYDDFADSEIFTWDYIQEQTKKKKLKEAGVPDSENPYITLPEMKIFTYDLAKLRGSEKVGMGAQFTLAEFFRTWSGNRKKDKAEMPEGAKGKFVHEEAVNNFLNLLCSEDGENNYPFSTEEYQENFKHTLWAVPGVAEAKALTELLRKHEIFRDVFQVINVAGEGDNDEQKSTALDSVLNAIGDSPDQTATITISCGRLTTGVTVPPWTAVFYLKGSDNTSAATYMQTIFRVQGSHVYKGKMKSQCYVFDFAPDRSLKAVAETAKFYNLSSKQRAVASQASKDSDLDKLRQFLSFCPVISLDGGRMVEFDEHKLFTKLHSVYIDKIVRSGYTDNALFNKDAIMQMDPDALKVLDSLDAKDRVKSKGKGKCDGKLNITDNDLNGGGGAPDEDPGDGSQNGKKKKKKYTPKELEDRKKKREELEKRRAKLRDITIRIPLLIFGGKFNDEEDITLDNFTRKVDDPSWREFMPKNIGKDDFNKLKKGINASMFVEAGKEIRKMTREADTMHVEERISKIAQIHNWFNNPNKETVLTPWRVVNMHLSDCLGGYCFMNEDFTGPNQEEVEDKNGETIFVDSVRPRFVNRRKVTADVFGSDEERPVKRESTSNIILAEDGSERPADALDIRILEINSKTGLYPLYATYSLYRNRLQDYIDAGLIDPDPENLSVEEEQVVWDDVLQNNLYVISNTRMAEAITRRTLYGFRPVKYTHIKHEPIVERAKTEINELAKQLRSSGFWNGTTSKNMLKFTAVIGNPPYQEMDGGTDASATPLYHHYVYVSKNLKSDYISMIMPARWYAGGKGLEAFRSEMISDKSIRVLHDYLNGDKIFNGVEIKGGICYFLRNSTEEGECRIVTHKDGEIINDDSRFLQTEGSKVMIRFAEGVSIFTKVRSKGEKTFDKLISTQKPFGLRTFVHGEPNQFPGSVKIYENGGIGYVSQDQITKNKEWVKMPKVYVSRAYNAGDNYPHQILGKPLVETDESCCTETYIVVGPFESKEEAKNVSRYITTKFFRVLVMLKKASQQAASDVYEFVPLQDFSKYSDIPWGKSTDEIDGYMYDKYNLSEEERDFIRKMIKPMN